MGGIARCDRRGALPPFLTKTLKHRRQIVVADSRLFEGLSSHKFNTSTNSVLRQDAHERGDQRKVAIGCTTSIKSLYRLSAGVLTFAFAGKSLLAKSACPRVFVADLMVIDIDDCHKSVHLQRISK